MRHWTLAILTLQLLTACGKGSSSSSSDQLVDKAVLENYADKVVVPTYQELAKRAAELQQAVAAMKALTTQETLDKIRAAWVATRVPWEQSEAFLFGPVETSGYDGAIDSWPLNKTDLDSVLAANTTLDEAYVSNLDPNLKGFHTLEFLIYGADSHKLPTDFTARQFDYLDAIAANLNSIASNLAKSWTDGEGDKEAFRTTLVTAGEAGNSVYPSVTSAAQDVVQGMAGICSEVADKKIANPFDAQDPNLVESQFSFNSLQDFADNIRSVQNAYLGARQGEAAPAGVSLSDHVAARDAALDERLKGEITAAIASLEAVPGPFPVTLLDPTAAPKIKAAQAAIRQVWGTLNTDVMELVKQ